MERQAFLRSNVERELPVVLDEIQEEKILKGSLFSQHLVGMRQRPLVFLRLNIEGSVVACNSEFLRTRLRHYNRVTCPFIARVLEDEAELDEFVTLFLSNFSCADE